MPRAHCGIIWISKLFYIENTQILSSNVYDIDTVKMNCKTYMYI